MNYSNTRRSALRRTLIAVSTALYTMVSGTVALGDDTEILTGQINDYAAPNIMFIIDTSGSMAADVLTVLDYDPSVTYSGPYDDPDRLYFTVADFSGDFNFPDAEYAQFGTYVNRDAFTCDAGLTIMATEGYHVDRYAQFDDSEGVFTWGPLGAYNDDPAVSAVNRYTECRTDDGVHGIAASSPDVYPVNVDIRLVRPLPWTDNSEDPDRFDWRGSSTTYAFFDGNFLNWIIEAELSGEPVVRSRLNVVQNVTNELVNARLAGGVPSTQQAFNVGLMRFSTNGEGGMVLQKVDNLSTSSAAFTQAVDSMDPANDTPLSETLFEAYQYFNGKSVSYGVNSQPQSSVADSQAGGSYISPITAACQKNYVILLTDGQPTSDAGANEAIANILGRECEGNCLDDLAQYMNVADASTTEEGVQTVQLFAIGFFTDLELLEQAATGVVAFDANGDPLDEPTPGYFIADDTEDLENAFNQIFQEIRSDVSTFTSPAVSVNSLNRLQNRNVLYFTMFTPAPQGQPHWDGNLKAYYLGRPGNVNSGDNLPDVTILDAGFNDAIDGDGIFRDNARSIWSVTADGPSVTEGGFASRLGTNRRVVTNVAGGALFSAGNRVDSGNDNITAQQLGVMVGAGDNPADVEARRLELLDFAAGLNSDGTARKVIGDPLHTQPLIVTYGGGSEDLRLFFTTNDGYFHAVDPTPVTDTSNEDLEEFAFIPKELLSQIDEQERNPESIPGASNKMYGLDGALTAYIDAGVNGNDDFIVEGNERLYIYIGMRRGGKSYYALDLGPGGDEDPQLAFQIDRGDTGFEKLGQTWSAATPARINYNGSQRDVLIFGGGYDTNQDTNNNEDSEGNAIYIVDATSGALIWSASNTGATLTLPDMTYSIPSDISVLDINQDGLTDRLYVGDMGGQVWRFDIVDGDITGAKFAELGGANSDDERRFFNRPSVSRIVTEYESFLTVAIGSGWRARPLNTTVEDRLYVLKDPNVFLPPVDGTTGDIIYPAAWNTDDLGAIDLQNQANTNFLQSGGGWYLDLPQSGEKNLSPALIADNRVFFTTYAPGSTGTLSCEPQAAVGNGRLYVLDILTGLPALDESDATDPGFVDLIRTGIPPTPTLVFTEPPCIENCDGDVDPDSETDGPITATNNGTCVGAASEASLLVATETFDVGICTAPARTYWVETDQDADEL